MPYLCPGHVWTCGWGSTGPDVFPGRPWTQEYADRRMEQDAVKFAKGTLQLCPNLSQSTDALCAIADFAYNLGLGNLSASTLRRRILAEDWADVPYQLSRWVNAGGKRLQGLILRRAAEADLFKRADL